MKAKVAIAAVASVEIDFDDLEEGNVSDGYLVIDNNVDPDELVKIALEDDTHKELSSRLLAVLQSMEYEGYKISYRVIPMMQAI